MFAFLRFFLERKSRWVEFWKLNYVVRVKPTGSATVAGAERIRKGTVVVTAVSAVAAGRQWVSVAVDGAVAAGERSISAGTGAISCISRAVTSGRSVSRAGRAVRRAPGTSRRGVEGVVRHRFVRSGPHRRNCRHQNHQKSLLCCLKK